MSASKQKKVRNDLRAGGLDRKTEDQIKAEASSRRFKRNTIITVVVVVLVLAAAIVINSNLFYTKTTAVKVGGTDYSTAEFNFYFRNSYNVFVNQYGDGLIDSGTPLDEQNSLFGGTWADYFTEQAKAQMQQITALYDQAVANGYTPSQEDRDSIETTLSYYELYASYQNMTPDGYLAAVYGKGMTQDLYRQYMTRYITATGYGQSVMDGYVYSDEQLSDKYAELADDYDVISFHSYFVSNSSDESSDPDGDAQAAASHDEAQSIAASTTVSEFGDKVYGLLDDETKETYENGASTLSSMAGGDIASYYPECSEWLLDPARAEGDTTVVDTDTGSYALMFVSRDDNRYNLVNVRHILITPDTDENGEYTTETLEAAHDRISEIEEEWLADPTEDNFAELANEYSDDSGSNTTGGLYEDIYKGRMVKEFDEFCFAGHQPGDTGIVYNENTGYHLIYFVGEGPVYADYIADNIMRNEDFNNYIDEISSAYDVSEGFSLRFANRK